MSEKKILKNFKTFFIFFFFFSWYFLTITPLLPHLNHSLHHVAPTKTLFWSVLTKSMDRDSFFFFSSSAASPLVVSPEGWGHACKFNYHHPSGWQLVFQSIPWHFRSFCFGLWVPSALGGGDTGTLVGAPKCI